MDRDLTNDSIYRKINYLQTLGGRIAWVRVLTGVGAIVCSLWLIYRVFAAYGFLLAFVTFVTLGIIYIFWKSLMLAVAASILCFYFSAVGLWLPITSCVFATILLYIDLKQDKFRRRIAAGDHMPISGKKQTLSDAEKSKLADDLALMFSIQMVATPARSTEVTQIEITKGCINRKAIGYIYGFIDCALQSRGEDITNVPVGIPVLYLVMRKLFPGHEQAYVDFLLQGMDDELVLLGIMMGGQQYSEFISKPDAKGVPMGLARSILEGRQQQG